MKNSFSRRDFVKAEIIATVVVTGAGTLTACSLNSDLKNKQEIITLFHGENWVSEDGLAGMLFSQIGYESELPVRIIVRLPKKELLPINTFCCLNPSEKGKMKTRFRISRVAHWVDAALGSVEN